MATDYSEIRIKLKFDGGGAGGDGGGPNVPPDTNIPPTGDMLVALRSLDGRRTAEKMRWGLLPGWAKDSKLAYSTFNARAETVDQKPAFRGAWRAGRRCLVILDGFYEWRRSDRQAFNVSLADGTPMTVAGLWEAWTDPDSGEVIKTVTIITTEANDVMAALHDRMPVILGEADWPAWLGETPATEAELKALLRPCPSEWLKLWRVDNKVGNVRNKGPELYLPLDEGARVVVAERPTPTPRKPAKRPPPRQPGLF